MKNNYYSIAWKSYYWFWILLTVLVGGYIFVEKLFTLEYIVAIVDAILACVILYSYIYKKDIFPVLLMRVYFAYSLIANVILLFSSFNVYPPDWLAAMFGIIYDPESGYISTLISIIIIIPSLYATYKLAYKENSS